MTPVGVALALLLTIGAVTLGAGLYVIVGSVRSQTAGRPEAAAAVSAAALAGTMLFVVLLLAQAGLLWTVVRGLVGLTLAGLALGTGASVLTRRRRARLARRPAPPIPPPRHILADRLEVPIEHVIAAAEADATARPPDSPQGA